MTTPVEVDVRYFTWRNRPRDCGSYHAIHIATRPEQPPYEMEPEKWDQNRVQVSISPTGRSIQVYVDGKEWGPK